MSKNLTHIIIVNLEEGEGNLFIATSAGLPGLFLTYPDRKKLLEELPNAIRALYKAKFGEDVRVTLAEMFPESDRQESNRVPFVAVPAGVLKQMSAL